MQPLLLSRLMPFDKPTYIYRPMSADCRPLTRFPYFIQFAFLCVVLLSKNAFAGGCTHPEQKGDPQDTVRMVFGGDIVLGNNYVVDNIPASWDERYFAGVRSIIKDADIAFGNLEGVLSERGETTKTPGGGRQFAFRMPSRYSALLRDEGFDIMNVANNHAYDFGESGFRDTLMNLKASGIAYVGPRDHLATLSVRGLNVAMLGFSYSSRFPSVFDLEQNTELVRQAKSGGAYVIVTFHAGAEGPAAIWHEDKEEMFFGENRGNVVAFARAMVDAGADLVVGHGPHVLRAVECYKDRPIAYSLGNFVGVGGLSAKKMAAVSALLEVTVNTDGILQSLELVSLRFNEQKLPELDEREFGTRLVNQLGQQAKFKGTFVEFPVREIGDKTFERWLRSASH
ncbi:MAG TPA: metallophosphatase [Gallionellaceae bacterium]|nr:metallophosphatase [Gallionellaceae bacterium]